MLLAALAKLVAKVMPKSNNESLVLPKEPIQEIMEPVPVPKEAVPAIDESVREKYKTTYYDTETHSYRPCYEIKFIGGCDYGNFVDVDIDFELDKVTIWCHTPGSGVGYGTGYYDGGGCSYEFPYGESLEYLNLIAFVREKTWVRDNFYKVISREEFERQLAEIGYTED